jgi:transcription elongation factor GreB
MGRWKPPPPKSSPYITPEGYRARESELAGLWERRVEVVRALAAAAAEGDRSENAEYIYRKKELAGIDRRIGYLQRRLPGLEIVRQTPAGDRVFFGAWVRLARPDGGEHEYRIVGADETDTARGYISIDSPLARQLLKKAVGEEIEPVAGAAAGPLRVVAIRYG